MLEPHLEGEVMEGTDEVDRDRLYVFSFLSRKGNYFIYFFAVYLKLLAHFTKVTYKMCSD